MSAIQHLTLVELEAGLDTICQSPREESGLAMIVRRPAVGEREVMDEGKLDLLEGLIGDTWRMRGSSRTEDGSSHPDMQLTIMNARVIALLAQERRTLATRRGSIVYGFRLECGQCAGWDTLDCRLDRD